MVDTLHKQRRAITSLERESKKPRCNLAKKLKDYTEEDKQRVSEMVIQTQAQTTFKNHFYKWKGRVYKQMHGGAIGLRATGSLARITLDIWMKKTSALGTP